MYDYINHFTAITSLQSINSLPLLRPIRLPRQPGIFAMLKCRPNESLNKEEKVLSLICNFNDVSFQWRHCSKFLFYSARSCVDLKRRFEASIPDWASIPDIYIIFRDSTDNKGLKCKLLICFLFQRVSIQLCPATFLTQCCFHIQQQQCVTQSAFQGTSLTQSASSRHFYLSLLSRHFYLYYLILKASCSESFVFI